MASTVGLQNTRYELKYIISESCAEMLRNFFVQRHLVPDPYSSPENGVGYPVYSLYLDSPDFLLFRQTLTGLKNRYKLRIRVYERSSEAPAFLEIKRRVSDVILKERAVVSREGVGRLLRGERIDNGFLRNPTESAYKALDEFHRLCHAIEADGRAFVGYQREAYVSPNSNDVRVTFDRRLFGCPFGGNGRDLSLPDCEVYPEVGGVILELKFTNRFPEWMAEMSQTFGLERTSVPKYIHCVRGLNRADFLPLPTPFLFGTTG